MAFASHGSTTTILRNIGSCTTVPNHPVCQLKYYLGITSTLLGINADDPLRRDSGGVMHVEELRDYSSPGLIKEQDEADLMDFCMNISPDELIGSVFIQNDALCGESQNKLLAVSQIERGLIIPDRVMIRGKIHTVDMVMAFKPMWLVTYWIAPIKNFFLPSIYEAKLTKIRKQIPCIEFLESLTSDQPQVQPPSARPPIEFFKSLSSVQPQVRPPSVRPPTSSCCAIM